MTCDAWQASNADAYFAVTGSWIEETSPGVWKLQSALLGFTRMNSAHNGVRLGRALYKIAKRVGITHKVSIMIFITGITCQHYFPYQVGWVTCDNASNNDTMLVNFASRINKDPHRRELKVKEWDYEQRHIR